MKTRELPSKEWPWKAANAWIVTGWPAIAGLQEITKANKAKSGDLNNIVVLGLDPRTQSDWNN